MRDPDDAMDGARGHEHAFSKEADTVTTRDRPVIPRRDTMPVLAIGPHTPAQPLHVLASALSGGASPEAPASAEELADDDVLEDGGDLDDLDDDTQTEGEPFTPSDDPTSPTLSLAHRSDSTREVYRLFLASDYAPALALANDLIGQGEDDPMLLTIARECRSSLAGAPSPGIGGSSARAPRPSVTTETSLGSMSLEGFSAGELAGSDAPRPRLPHEPRPALRPPSPPLRPQRAPFTVFDGKMTIEQVAGMSGMSVEHVLGLLERFVAMGVLPLRPPR